MNPYWMQVVVQSTLRKRRKDAGKQKPVSSYRLAKGFLELRISAIRMLKDVVLMVLGIASAAFGIKGFLLTNHFIDGGATGISLLIAALSDMPLYQIIICINIPFVFLGYRIIGKAFAIKTAVSITLFALCLAVVPFPNITDDNLLVAVFGGFFLGAGIGLSVRGGAVLDGTEVLAIYLSRKLGTTLGTIIIAINALIFLAAAYFLSMEIALYSMITYLAASKTLDFVVEGIDEYIGVTIVSPHSDEIRKMIIEKIGRGVTVYNGKGGYGKKGETRDIEIVYSVVTRLELNRLNIEIKKIDLNAFVVMNSVKDTKRGMIKKRRLK